MNRAQELKEYAMQQIAARREKKATSMAFTAWACGISAEDMSAASPKEWAQLAEATRLSMKESYGEPSADTKRLILAKLRDLERKGMAA